MRAVEWIEQTKRRRRRRGKGGGFPAALAFFFFFWKDSASLTLRELRSVPALAPRCAVGSCSVPPRGPPSGSPLGKTQTGARSACLLDLASLTLCLHRPPHFGGDLLRGGCFVASWSPPHQSHLSHLFRLVPSLVFFRSRGSYPYPSLSSASRTCHFLSLASEPLAPSLRTPPACHFSCLSRSLPLTPRSLPPSLNPPLACPLLFLCTPLCSLPLFASCLAISLLRALSLARSLPPSLPPFLLTPPLKNPPLFLRPLSPRWSRARGTFDYSPHYGGANKGKISSASSDLTTYNVGAQSKALAPAAVERKKRIRVLAERDEKERKEKERREKVERGEIAEENLDPNGERVQVRHIRAPWVSCWPR